MDAGAVHCQAAKCSAALRLSSTTEKHKNKTVKSWKEQSDMEHGTELNSSKEGKHLKWGSMHPPTQIYLHASPISTPACFSLHLFPAHCLFICSTSASLHVWHLSILDLPREELWCNAPVPSKDTGKLPYTRSITQEEKWSTQVQHQGPHHQKMGALPREVIT